MFVFVWLRGTLPRIRYDQFMSIGWKVLIPVSLVWIVLVGAVRVLRNAEGFSTTEVLLWVGIPLAIVLIAAVAWPAKVPRRRRGRRARRRAARRSSRTRVAGGPVVAEARGRYPVPPLDLKVPIPPIRAARAGRAPGRRPRRAAPAPAHHELPGGSDVVS